LFQRYEAIGRIVKDPVPIANGRGIDVRIAINRNYQKDGEWVEETTYVTFTFWRPEDLQRIQEKVHKGDLLFLEGRLKNLEATLQDGTKRMELVVNGTSFKILPTKGRSAEGAPAAAPAAADSYSGLGTWPGDDPNALGDGVDEPVPF